MAQHSKQELTNLLRRVADSIEQCNTDVMVKHIRPNNSDEITLVAVQNVADKSYLLRITTL